MRIIDVNIIEDAVAALFVRANKLLPEDLVSLIHAARERESADLPRSVMDCVAANIDAARELDLPVCQDTGLAVLFCDVGQDVHFTGGSLGRAINRGVARAYRNSFLRCSVVADPLRRQNTGDNTPAVVHTRIVDGESVRLTAAPKGFGSENMSRLKMFTPSATRGDLMDFAVETVRAAGSNACPPMTVGFGLGGDFESCALLAKRALCRPASEKNPDPFYAAMEDELLERLNALNIGPQGFGGRTTVLSVAVEAAPTHIAGLPAAVNIGCHVNRHAEVVI